MAGILSFIALILLIASFLVEDFRCSLLYFAFAVKGVQCLVMHDRYYKSFEEKNPNGQS